MGNCAISDHSMYVEDFVKNFCTSQIES